MVQSEEGCDSLKVQRTAQRAGRQGSVPVAVGELQAPEATLDLDRSCCTDPASGAGPTAQQCPASGSFRTTAQASHLLLDLPTAREKKTSAGCLKKKKKM